MKKVILTLALMTLISGCGNFAGKGKPGHIARHQAKSQKQLIYHVNPMPNLMQVVVKYGDQLSLSQEQQDALAKWRENNRPLMAEVRQNILAQEKQLREMALSDTPEAALLEQYQQIENLRARMAGTKIKCRSMMQSLLSEQQFKQLQQIYKDQLLSRHML